MASYLVNDSKYAFLKELGLGENNCGVFHGKWAANGPVTESFAPANNQPIAKVCIVSLQLYKDHLFRSRTEPSRTTTLPSLKPERPIM